MIDPSLDSIIKMIAPGGGPQLKVCGGLLVACQCLHVPSRCRGSHIGHCRSLASMLCTSDVVVSLCLSLVRVPRTDVFSRCFDARWVVVGCTLLTACRCCLFSDPTALHRTDYVAVHTHITRHQRARIEVVQKLNRNPLDTESYDAFLYLVRPNMSLMKLLANQVRTALSHGDVRCAALLNCAACVFLACAFPCRAVCVVDWSPTRGMIRVCLVVCVSAGHRPRPGSTSTSCRGGRLCAKRSSRTRACSRT